MRLPAVLIAIGAALLIAAVVPAADTATVETPNGALSVAVADTVQERQKGLQDRSSVPRDGMLFIHETAAGRSYWMKETRIPLDIIFIGADGTVRNVEAAAPETGQDHPRRYRSEGEALYVLEVRQGGAERLDITAGTELAIDRSPSGPIRLPWLER